MPRAKKPTWWEKWRGAVIGSGAFVGAVVAIWTFVHPVTTKFIGDPPFASRSDLSELAQAKQLAEVDAKSQFSLQYLQQNTISNAQDWYEQYRRQVIELQNRISRNRNDLSAQRDLEFAVRRRDFYKGQLDLSERSNQDLVKMLKTTK